MKTILLFFVCMLFLIVPISAEEQTITLSSHFSQTVFGTYLYLNGLEQDGANNFIAKMTVGFANGDYENFDLNLEGKKDYTSHYQNFVIGSYSKDNLQGPYQDGNYAGDILLTIRELARPTPAPTLSPTPTLPPPTPIPTPIITPTAVPVIIVSTPIPTPAQTYTPAPVTPSSAQWGVMRFESEPDGAVIYIDGKKLGFTPRTRDLSPGKYNITISKDGYLNFSQVVNLRNEDVKEINVKLEKEIIENLTSSTIQDIEIVQPDANSSLSISSQDDNMTDNVTIVTTTEKDMNFTAIVIAVISVILLVSLYFTIFRKIKGDVPVTALTDENNEENDENDMKRKIKEMIDKDPNITNAEMAEILDVSVRTIQRNK